MVWHIYSNMIKQGCENAAVLGLESKLPWTTKDNGLNLCGEECEIINSTIRTKGESTRNSGISIEGKIYYLEKFDEDAMLFIYKNNTEYNIVIAVSKMVVLIGYDKNYNNCISYVVGVQQKLLSMGL